MNYLFTSSLIKKVSNLMWNHRVEVPLEISIKLFPPASKGAKRVLCKLNNKCTIQIALTPDGNGNFYLVINKEVHGLKERRFSLRMKFVRSQNHRYRPGSQESEVRSSFFRLRTSD